VASCFRKKGSTARQRREKKDISCVKPNKWSRRVRERFSRSDKIAILWHLREAHKSLELDLCSLSCRFCFCVCCGWKVNRDNLYPRRMSAMLEGWDATNWPFSEWDSDFKKRDNKTSEIIHEVNARDKDRNLRNLSRKGIFNCCWKVGHNSRPLDSLKIHRKTDF
jgi:hypothetical protein